MAPTRTPTFAYTPLSTSRHIRVLELQREDNDSTTLKARLLELDLGEEDHIPYAALSYTWGKPVFSELLVLDDMIFQITPNLARALRHFRATSCLKWVWADAICINQKDDVEKSLQIPLMAKIFRDASRVMVWLGDEYSAISAMKTVQTASRRISSREETVRNEERVDLVEHLLLISKLPWFSRRWVIQELILNPSVSFFCGYVELAWQRLVEVILYVRNGPQLNHVHHTSENVTTNKNFVNFNEPIAEASETASIAAVLSLWNLWQTWSIPSVQLNKPAPKNTIALLNAFDHFECSDDRDRIHALTALAQDVGSGQSTRTVDFRIDYSQTVEQVLMAFAEALVRADQLHEVLDSALSRNAGKNTTLPSWVPDWRITLKDKNVNMYVNKHRRNSFEMVDHGRPQIITSIMLCADKKALVSSTTQRGIRGAKRKSSYTLLKIVWVSPAFQPEDDWTMYHWTEWALAAIIDLLRFVLENSGMFVGSQDDVLKWNKPIIYQAIRNLAPDTKCKDFLKVRKALYENINFRRPPMEWVSKTSTTWKNEAAKSIEKSLHVHGVTPEQLEPLPKCMFLCDVNLFDCDVGPRCVMGNVPSKVMPEDILVFLPSGKEYEDIHGVALHNYVIRCVAQVDRGTVAREKMGALPKVLNEPQNTIGIRTVTEKQSVYKVISKCPLNYCRWWAGRAQNIKPFDIRRWLELEGSYSSCLRTCDILLA